MSDPVQQFVALTRKAVVDVQARKNHPLPAGTFMRFCPACREMTPHDETALGWLCIFHYSHPKPLLSERGESLAEYAIVAALVVLVLIFAGHLFGWSW